MDRRKSALLTPVAFKDLRKRVGFYAQGQNRIHSTSLLAQIGKIEAAEKDLQNVQRKFQSTTLETATDRAVVQGQRAQLAAALKDPPRLGAVVDTKVARVSIKESIRQADPKSAVPKDTVRAAPCKAHRPGI